MYARCLDPSVLVISLWLHRHISFSLSLHRQSYLFFHYKQHFYRNVDHGSSNGQLHYPDVLDRPLHETDVKKNGQDRDDNKNCPSNAISFIPGVDSTSGLLHCDFVCLLFWQTHRETDCFFAASGVHLTQTNTQYHYRHVTFSSQLKSKVRHILDKTVVLRINLNIDDEPITSNLMMITYSPITFSNLSPFNLVSIFRCSSPPHNPVYERHVDSPVLTCRLSFHRHPHMCLLFSSSFYLFIINKFL